MHSSLLLSAQTACYMQRRSQQDRVSLPESFPHPFTVHSNAAARKSGSLSSCRASRSSDEMIAAARMAAGASPDDAAVRYQAYSRLQAAALAMGETLPIPEIVVRRVPRSTAPSVTVLCHSMRTELTCCAGYWRPVGRQEHTIGGTARGVAAVHLSFTCTDPLDAWYMLTSARNICSSAST